MFDAKPGLFILSIDILWLIFTSFRLSVYSLQRVDFFYTFKGALNCITIKLYSMANIERAIKAVLAKRGLEYSLKDETFKCISAIVKW